nr:hypothetical protein CR513_29242 [Ipomoea batatas]GMC53767.1 hypothetical protein CR513_29242 [Ipomoea batatas]
MVRRGWSCGKDDFLHEVCVHASRLDDVSPPPSLSPADEYQLDDEENTRKPQHRPSAVHNLRLLVPFQALGIICGRLPSSHGGGVLPGNQRGRLGSAVAQTVKDRDVAGAEYLLTLSFLPERKDTFVWELHSNDRPCLGDENAAAAMVDEAAQAEAMSTDLCTMQLQGVIVVLCVERNEKGLNTEKMILKRRGLSSWIGRLDDVSPLPSLSPANEYQLNDKERCCISEVLLLRQLRECAETYSGVAEGLGFQPVLGPGAALRQVAASTRWRRILTGGIVFGLAWAPFSAPEFSSSPARRLTNTPALLSSLSSATLSLPWRYQSPEYSK